MIDLIIGGFDELITSGLQSILNYLIPLVMGLSFSFMMAYGVWWGWQFIQGNNDPVEDLVGNMVRMALVSFIAFSSSKIAEIYNILSEIMGYLGGVDLNALLTRGLTLFTKYADQVKSLKEGVDLWSTEGIGNLFLMIGATFNVIIIFVFLMLTVFQVFMMLIRLKITLFYVISTTPIFVSSVLWDYSRPWFKNWVNMILYTLVASVLYTVTINLVEGLIGLISYNETVGFQDSLMVGVIWYVCNLVSTELTSIASSLTGGDAGHRGKNMGKTGFFGATKNTVSKINNLNKGGAGSGDIKG